MLGRATLPLLAVIALVASGCLSVKPTAPGSPSDLVPTFTSTAVSKDTPGAEPVIAALPDGTLFVQGIGGAKPVPQSPRNVNLNTLWRSTDGGKTWADVTPPGLANEESHDGFVATGNGASVYLENTAGLTFEPFRSDDKGATWTPLPTVKLPLLMHRSWIVPVGASTVEVVMEAFPPTYATYLGGQRDPTNPQSGTPNEGLWYMSSTDKGMTWSAPTQIDPIVNFAGQSNLVASVDGKFMAVVRYTEPYTADGPHYTKGTFYLIYSEDGGATWGKRDMFPLTSELASAIEPLTLDSNGVMTMAWSQAANGTSQLRFAISKDHGKTWSAPRTTLAAPTTSTQAMPFIVNRAPGEIGVVWYQADVVGPASKVNASWHGMYALVTGADTDTPTATTTAATAEIHHGNICARGPACGPGEDRRLLDYPWLVFDARGLPRAAFASTEWSAPSAFAVYAGAI
ncbi:MAG: sialidase family protein [Thermoplasmatota archaeon]